MSASLPAQTVRVGVIGLGFGGETALKCFKQLPDVEVVALAGLEEDKLEQLGETYTIPHLYHDYQDLLERDDIDAVSIGLPNFLHAPAGIAALNRGLHVLCEKPLARTNAEAESMVEAANAANRVLKVIFNHRQRGDVQVLKRSIDEGLLGTIYYAKASWMRRRGIPGMGSWFVNPKLSGGGPLIDLGVHILDMALHLMGEPEIVTASAMTYNHLGTLGIGVGGRHRARFGSNNIFEVEDLATAFLRTKEGATLLLESSWATHSSAGDDYGVVLYGTRGGAEIKVKNYGWEDTLRIYTDVAGVTAEIKPTVPRGEYHLGVVREFIDEVRGGEWAGYNGSEGLKRTRVIDACYASAKLGREVVLGE